jgi:SWI/SNF-related matrix-associated actin-dependent regulator 1 of chromatin subfamily A
MKITKKGELYVCECSYAERNTPKSAGFRWDYGRRQQWETNNPLVAARLIQYATPEARQTIEAALDAARESVRESLSANADIDIPHPDGLDYLPFQKAGIAFALKRTATWGADEMGLGKTVQAIGFINAKRGEIGNVLIVCPASVKLNWRAELERWLVWPEGKPTIHVVNGRGSTDSEAEIVIVNYDVLGRHRDWVIRRKWDLIILDEAHFCKNRDAKRTRALLGLTATYKWALTGTPILNTPADLHPILDWLQPGRWDGWWDFARR